MKLEPAQLTWTSGVPWSARYQDIYYARQGVEQETHYVFFQHNRLPQRWEHPGQFSIGETGFGTGLNFLLSWDLWRKTAPKTAELQYISIEKHPFQAQDLQRIYRQFPHLAPIAEQLLAHYPPLIKGQHLLQFEHGRLRLLLIFDDVMAALQGLVGKVDAWFLDGFAPQRNPAMWRAEVCQLISAHTAAHGSFSTYTATGLVRRNLTAVGFEVRKAAGFGQKREMLQGDLTTRTPQHATTSPPWFTLPTTSQTATEAVVIGAGIAGCACAYALAQRGWRVTVLDRGNTVAQGASGNPKGILQPKLTTDYKPLARYYTHAFLLATRTIRTLIQQGCDIDYQACGVAELATNAKQRQRQAKLCAVFGTVEDFLQPIPADQAAAMLHIATSAGGLLYPQGGWVNPKKLCAALLDAFGQQIQLQTHCDISTLTYEHGLWSLCQGEQHVARAPVVIIANSAQAKRFSQCAALPLTHVRGQLTDYPQTAMTAPLTHVLCGDGYLLPADNGRHILGAAFDADLRADLSAACQTANITRVSRLLETPLAQDVPLRGRVAMRCSAGDYLPLVGALPQWSAYAQDYADLALGKPHRCYPPASYWPGLFLSTAHGSRGLSGAILAAQTLAAMILQSPLPIDQETLQAIHPARFWVRDLTRGRL